MKVFFNEIWKRDFWLGVTKIAIGTAIGGAVAIGIVLLGIMVICLSYVIEIGQRRVSLDGM